MHSETIFIFWEEKKKTINVESKHKCIKYTAASNLFFCNLQSRECIPFPGPPAEKDPPPPNSIYDTVQDVSASDEIKIHNKKFLEIYTYVCIST